MAVADNLEKVADLCRTGAKRSLDKLLGLGPKPDDPSQALLWEQQATRLQGQINSLSALVSKLTAAAVISNLDSFSNELTQISQVSDAAEERIKRINDVSELLSRLAGVLDLGLAILAAAAAPTPATIAAALSAADAVAGTA